MPNWCYNHLDVEGSEKEIATIKAQLNAPFEVEHDSYNMETRQMERKLFKYSNPVFAFWNIIKPTDLEAYHGPQPSVDINKPITFDSNHWYDWNVRNWGTKWDVANKDDEKFPETELSDESKTYLGYRFNTAWSPPVEAIYELSRQYPSAVFTLSYEEETGWGGEVVFTHGKGTETESYGWKCRECENTEDETPYCEECEFDTCPECGYNESDEPCNEHLDGKQ